MPSTTTVKARYLGPVLLSGPGDPASMDNAVKRLRASAQVARASVHISNESVKITDRAGKDVLLLAERENICCHGMQPNSTTFLCLVVDQNSRYYCHVINMPKSEASKACRALVDCFGGGDGEIVPSWKSKNKKRLRQSVKPGRRRSSISAAPSNGFDEHATRSVASPRAVVVSAEQLARERETFPRKFVGMYLGAQPVDALFGADVIRKAVEENGQERLRQHMADTTAGFGDPVTVIVSTQNVRTMDRTTGSVMMSEFIKNISYTSVLDSVDGNDVFAFIAVNKRIGGIHCHIYHVPRGQGQLAYMAVETAFKLLAADEKAIGDNPFAVTDPKREPAPAILFKHQIHRADLKALQQIGAGQFGAVYTAYQYTRNKETGMTEKVKRAVKLLRNAASAEDKHEFTHEAETMLNLNHPNLVSMIGVAIQQKPWLCVLEYMEYGDLRSLVASCRDKNIPLYDGEFYLIGKQLAAGCAYLSAMRLVHMDLAARNALVTKNNTVKVADFGLTRPMDEGRDHLVLRETMRLALKWIAPEGMESKRFSQASDVWSFGVTMWEVLTYGATPYGRIKTADIQAKIRSGTRLPRPPMCSDAMCEILNRCWRAEPEKRPTFKDLELELSTLHAAHEPPDRDIGALVASQRSGRGAVKMPSKSKSQSALAQAFGSQPLHARKSRSASQITPPKTSMLASVFGGAKKAKSKRKSSKDAGIAAKSARSNLSGGVNSIMEQMTKAYGTEAINAKPEGADLPDTYMDVDQTENGVMPSRVPDTYMDVAEELQRSGAAVPQEAEESYVDVAQAVTSIQQMDVFSQFASKSDEETNGQQAATQQQQPEEEEEEQFGFGDLA